MQNKKSVKQKQGVKSQAIGWVLVVAAGVVQALGLYIFVLPNNFSPGGVTGIATAIFFVTGLNTGYFIIAFNVPLLIAAWFILKRDFVIKTAVSILLASALLIVLPYFNIYQYKTDQPLLAAVASGVIGGAVIGVLFRVGGSNGGSEIMGRFIQRKFPQYNVSWFIFGLDVAVVVGTAFVILGVDETINPLDVILLSIIKLFLTSMVSSTLMQGFNSAIKFEIITEHAEELAHEILEELSRGVTVVSARGGYTGASKSVLLCVVRKRQLGPFQKILKKYPDTFAYITNAKEVYGRGFSLPNNATTMAREEAETKEVSKGDEKQL
ncbi:MAG: YitT family protein [Firmicutes bacterium]|nr:YitT family protein [Bacillota bacterium]